MEKIIQLYCDGASKGNPGPAGIGAIGYLNGTTIIEISEAIGNTTNNFAEYRAVLRGLEEIKNKLSSKNLNEFIIEIYLDSELVAKQLQGLYKIQNHHLKEMYLKIKSILKDFFAYKIIHIPREKNQIADNLASLHL